MKLPSQRVLRALRLLWGRLGRARLYVAAAAAAIVVLAAIGVANLVAPSRDDRPVSDQPPPPTSASRIVASTPPPSPAPPAPAPAGELAREPLVLITDLKSHRRRLRDRTRLVAARIGVAPQTNAKVADVEIRVAFYDVTRDGEMRPTVADVAYEWLTPVRDWSDPRPKYLVATYVRARQPRNSGERLRYGGFIVQVYANGQLQDERSEPKQILARLRQSAGPRETANPADRVAPATPTDLAMEDDEREADLESDATLSQPPPAATVVASPTQTPTPRPVAGAGSSTAPIGKPVPGKAGFIFSHDEKFIIDVRGMPSGTEITDPYTRQPLRIP